MATGVNRLKPSQCSSDLHSDSRNVSYSSISRHSIHFCAISILWRKKLNLGGKKKQLNQIIGGATATPSRVPNICLNPIGPERGCDLNNIFGSRHNPFQDSVNPLYIWRELSINATPCQRIQPRHSSLDKREQTKPSNLGLKSRRIAYIFRTSLVQCYHAHCIYEHTSISVFVLARQVIYRIKESHKHFAGFWKQKHSCSYIKIYDIVHTSTEITITSDFVFIIQ